MTRRRRDSGEGLRGKTISARGTLVSRYVDYITALRDGQAGKLTPGEGESVLTLRRRLISAARFAGKELRITRAGDVVYFWVASRPEGREGQAGVGPEGFYASFTKRPDVQEILQRLAQ